MPDRSSTILHSQPFAAHDRPVGSQMLLSLAIPPVLIGLACAHTVSEALASLGLTSEEIFRGDRLPLLNREQLENSPAKS
ncbi:MAG: hypothetical protein AB4352_18300 [Hormoscilla sp.]